MAKPAKDQAAKDLATQQANKDRVQAQVPVPSPAAPQPPTTAPE